MFYKPGLESDISIDDVRPLQLTPVFDFNKITQQNIADAFAQLSSSQVCGQDGIMLFIVRDATIELSNWNGT